MSVDPRHAHPTIVNAEARPDPTGPSLRDTDPARQEKQRHHEDQRAASQPSDDSIAFAKELFRQAMTISHGAHFARAYAQSGRISSDKQHDILFKRVQVAQYDPNRGALFDIRNAPGFVHSSPQAINFIPPQEAPSGQASFTMEAAQIMALQAAQGGMRKIVLTGTAGERQMLEAAINAQNKYLPKEQKLKIENPLSLAEKKEHLSLTQRTIHRPRADFAAFMDVQDIAPPFYSPQKAPEPQKTPANAVDPAVAAQDPKDFSDEPGPLRAGPLNAAPVKSETAAAFGSASDKTAEPIRTMLNPQQLFERDAEESLSRLLPYQHEKMHHGFTTPSFLDVKNGISKIENVYRAPVPVGERTLDLYYILKQGNPTLIATDDSIEKTDPKESRSMRHALYVRDQDIGHPLHRDNPEAAENAAAYLRKYGTQNQAQQPASRPAAPVAEQQFALAL